MLCSVTSGFFLLGKGWTATSRNPSHLAQPHCRLCKTQLVWNLSLRSRRKMLPHLDGSYWPHVWCPSERTWYKPVTNQRFLVHYCCLASRSLWGKQPCNVYKMHWKESVLPEIRGGDELEFCRQSLLLSTMWQGNKHLERAKMLIGKKGFIKAQYLQSVT